MSLQTCPRCSRQVLTFGRFLLMGSKSTYECPGCKATLFLHLRYHGLSMFALAALFYIVSSVLLKRVLPTPEIPLGLAVALILVFFVLLKAGVYLLAGWQVKQATTDAVVAGAPRDHPRSDGT